MALGMPTKIREIMSKYVVTIDEGKSAIEAARLMTEKGIGSLMVTKEGKTIGIITERDLVVRVLAKGVDPRTTKVEEVMTKPIITSTPDTPIADVVKLMSRYKIRRVPIVENETLVGIVTAYDTALYGWGIPAHPHPV